MAIGRVSGEMLEPTLERDGVDLAITGSIVSSGSSTDNNLLYFDATNNRVGIKTSLLPITFTGTIAGTALTVTIPPLGGTKLIKVGMTLTGSGVVSGTKILSGTGTSWVVDQSQTISTATAITGTLSPNFDIAVTGLTNINNLTNTTTPDDGAFVVSGGAGVGKDLRVGGDIYTQGKKVATLDLITGPPSRRKDFSFTIPSLTTGSTYLYTAELGYAGLVYSLTVTVPVKVEVFGSAAAQTTAIAPNPYEPNPYTFIATRLSLTDSGTIYFSDGTTMKTRQYSMFANLEDPTTKNIYFKITGINEIHGGWAGSNLSVTASFTGTLSGTTLTVTSALVTGRALGVGMTLTGAGVISGTKITAGSGLSWTVDKTYSSPLTGVALTGTFLTNTLSLRYVDMAGDGGNNDVSTVSVLPAGYTGQFVFLTTSNTLYVYFGGQWRPI